MSTQRINALPSGTGTHTGTARIAYEDSNDASNTTKFLDVTSLGNEFLPLAGGTMSGDIDMNINDIIEIGTLLFKNIGTGANPSLFSNTNAARQLSLNGDFIVQTTGKLGFGSSFFEDVISGTTFNPSDKFIINYPNVILNELISPRNTGILSSINMIGETILGSPAEYSDNETIIVNNNNSLFSGGVNHQVAFKGVIETNVIGININDQKELFIYDNIRFNNLGTGADPILFANSTELILSLSGNFSISGFHELTEITLPSNPAVNKGLIYLRDVAGITTPFFLDSSGTETAMIGDTGAFLPLAGGTMTGNIDMGGNDIDSVGILTFFNSGGTNPFFSAVVGATAILELSSSLQMGGDIDMSINDITEIGTTIYKNIGAGTDPILSSNSANQELSLNGDFLVLTDGKLGFGTNFLREDSVLGPILNLDDAVFTILYNNKASLDLVGTSSTLGALSVNSITGKDTSNNDRIYASTEIDILDNTPTNFTGAQTLKVAQDGNSILESILGINVDSDGAVKVFNSLRLENSTDSTLDSFIESNNGSGQQLAVWKGSMQMDFTKQAELAQIGIVTYQGFHTAPVAPSTTITRHEYFDRNSLSQNRAYVRIDAMVEDDTAAAEEGSYLIQARSAGSLASFIDINSGGNGFTLFTKPINLAGNEIDNIDFGDFDVIADPGNPVASHGRVYAKVIDGTNDGLFIRIKKNNIFTEVQIA